MAGELTIEKNTDGTATINFPGGGQHTIQGDINDLQKAYGDRIGNIVSSGISSAEQAANSAAIRQTERDDVLTRTTNGVGLITDTTGDGYSTEDIQNYVNASGRFSSVEDAVNKTRADGQKILSKYFDSETINSMSTKQLLAAAELNYQGNGDTGRTNGLSVQDLDFIVNQANNFAASVWSPNTQAISTGYDPVASPVISNPGISQDTRDWGQIVASENPVIAAQIATNQMYGGTSIDYVSGGYQYDANGDLVLDGLGQPVREAPSLHLVGGNGAIIQKITEGMQNLPQILQNFGVRDTSWLNGMQQYMSSDMVSSLQNYNPYADFGNLWENTYITGVGEAINPFFTLEEEKPTTTNQPTSQEQDQTIYSPVAETVEEATADVTKPVYEDAPQAGDSVPLTPTTYTPTPTTVTGQTVQTGVTGTGIYPQTPVTGTMSTPLQTAGLSSVPETVQVRDNYTGTTMNNLTSQSQGGFGGLTSYSNQFGNTIQVTEDASGNPLTYVPPGYSKAAAQGGVIAMAEGGDVQLARKFLGFQGPADQLTNFLSANPSAAARMGKYQQAMSGMARVRPGAQEGTAGLSLEDFQKMQQNLITQTMQPQQAAVNQLTPQAADFIAPTAGQATAVSPMAQAATVGSVQQAQMPMMADTSKMSATVAAPSVQAETEGLQAQTGTVSDQAQVAAQQQLATSVSGMEAAQGTATMVNAPAAREIQAGELISGVADAEKAAQFNEQIQAATATPTKQATVQGQLEGLMQQFEGGNTPPWAAGSMRAAMSTLAARGLSASSMAGQAVIQAAMESALPIAQIDAQTQAQFESQNLSNRQQRAMLAAQQRAQFLGQEFDQAFQARVQNSARIGDIANMNFTAEQNIALENSRAANTMNLNNLSNRQAMVMAEAAALSNLDMANLNNRQQAAVQNAQNFLQMDMQNLNNAQQTEMFKSQQNIQALLTDQAAENAASQFNATSENQTNQFFASLSSQVSQFNASQQNAMDQFNVNATNAMRQFNSQTQQQRDLFNAQNGLVVAQANAQWRQNIATLNNAAQNESNLDFAKTINALTSKNLDEVWQRERDNMSFAFTSSESAMDRALQIVLADKELESVRTQLAAEEDAASTSLMFRFLFGTSNKGLLSGII